MRVRMLVLMLCLLTNIGCERSATADGPVTIDQSSTSDVPLPEALRGRDVTVILNALNSATKEWYMQHETSTLPLYLDLWNSRRESHPDIAWDLVELPQVRLTVASQLLQAWRNGLTALPEDTVSEMHELAKANLANSDEFIVEKAARVLGQSNRQDDVALLLELARGASTRGTFAAAVDGIASICGEEATQALSALGGERRYQGVLENVIRIRASTMRAWCKAPEYE